MAFWDLFGGSVVKGVSEIATEWIETDMESAEAKAVMVKALDPNGGMRRDISNKVSVMYILYICTTLILLICQSFGIGNVEGTEKALSSVTDLFLPITGMFTAIVGASFGVNGVNSFKGK